MKFIQGFIDTDKSVFTSGWEPEYSTIHTLVPLGNYIILGSIPNSAGTIGIFSL